MQTVDLRSDLESDKVMAYVEKAERSLLARVSKGSPPRKTLKQRNQRAGIFFVLPATIFIGLFFIVPLIMTGWMSLTNWPLLGDARFIGFANYTRAFTDATFWQSLLFTTKYTLVVTPIIIGIAFILALLVYQRVPGVGFFRTIYFMPVVIGIPVASLLWVWMFNDQVGVFDAILMALKFIKQPIIWLADPTTAILAIGVMIVWKTVGSSMLFFLIGINAISDEYYEAARVDGAGWLARTFYITLPLLRRTFALAVVLSVIGSYLAFDQFYIMTQGAPQNQTITVVYWIFNNSFVYYKLGYGAALSIILLGFLIIFTILQLYLLRDDAKS